VTAAPAGIAENPFPPSSRPVVVTDREPRTPAPPPKSSKRTSVGSRGHELMTIFNGRLGRAILVHERRGRATESPLVLGIEPRDTLHPVWVPRCANSLDSGASARTRLSSSRFRRRRLASPAPSLLYLAAALNGAGCAVGSGVGSAVRGRGGGGEIKQRI
jgi:hypothetical protein